MLNVWMVLCPVALDAMTINKTQFNPPLLQQTLRWGSNNLKQPYDKWFASTLPNTAWTTITRFQKAGINLTYVVTGDISAMWFRDSYNQVQPYLKHMHADPEVKDMLLGLIRYQGMLLMLDPYPNAYYNETHKFKAYKDQSHRLLFDVPFVVNQGLVHERKYEIDSCTFFIKLVNQFYQQYQDFSFLDPHFVRALRSIRQLIYQQLDDMRRAHSNLPLHYSFKRAGFPNELKDGQGAKGSACGLVRSGFRPSDDACEKPYNIPGNSLLAIQLHKLSINLLTDLLQTKGNFEPIRQLSLDFQQLSMRIQSSLKLHATTQVNVQGQPLLIYAQETDCQGGHTIGDDPNLPSLMSLPLYNYTMRFDPIWINTKFSLYSSANRYYFTDKQKGIEGLGSTHTLPSFIWPIGIITRMLTSQDEEQIEHCLKMLVQQSEFMMHESFQVSNPERYTRQWFAWANSMFAGAVLSLSKGPYAKLLVRQNE